MIEPTLIVVIIYCILLCVFRLCLKPTRTGPHNRYHYAEPMNKTKKKKLEDAGWKVGSAEDFLEGEKEDNK
jgi:hypothetical protein